MTPRFYPTENWWVPITWGREIFANMWKMCGFVLCLLQWAVWVWFSSLLGLSSVEEKVVHHKILAVFEMWIPCTLNHTFNFTVQEPADQNPDFKCFVCLCVCVFLHIWIVHLKNNSGHLDKCRIYFMYNHELTYLTSADHKVQLQ